MTIEAAIKVTLELEMKLYSSVTVFLEILSVFFLFLLV